MNRRRRSEMMKRLVDVSYIIWHSVVDDLVFDKNIPSSVREENAVFFTMVSNVFLFPTRKLLDVLPRTPKASMYGRRGPIHIDKRYKNCSKVYRDLLSGRRTRLFQQIATRLFDQTYPAIFRQTCYAGSMEDIAFVVRIGICENTFFCENTFLPDRWETMTTTLCSSGKIMALQFLAENKIWVDEDEFHSKLVAAACRSTNPAIVYYTAARHKELNPSELFDCFECVCKNACLDVVRAFVEATDFRKTIASFPDYYKVLYYDIGINNALESIQEHGKSRDVVDFLCEYFGKDRPENALWYKRLSRDYSITSTAEYGCHIDLVDVCTVLGGTIAQLEETDLPNVFLEMGSTKCHVSLYRDGHAVSVGASTISISEDTHKNVCDMLQEIGYNATISSFQIVKMYG